MKTRDEKKLSIDRELLQLWRLCNGLEETLKAVKKSVKRVETARYQQKQELLSSPEKKEVCKEAFESGYGGKLSKKAEKEFENIYSKLEKKEEVFKCKKCGKLQPLKIAVSTSFCNECMCLKHEFRGVRNVNGYIGKYCTECGLWIKPEKKEEVREELNSRNFLKCASKPEKKEEVKIYNTICKGCCRTIGNIAFYNGENIGSILCEECENNHRQVEKEEPEQFTVEDLKYLRQIVDVEVTLSEKVGEKRIMDMAKKVLSKIEKMLK